MMQLNFTGASRSLIIFQIITPFNLSDLEGTVFFFFLRMNRSRSLVAALKMTYAYATAAASS